jgi:hypothetical protein
LRRSGGFSFSSVENVAEVSHDDNSGAERENGRWYKKLILIFLYNKNLHLMEWEAKRNRRKCWSGGGERIELVL